MADPHGAAAEDEVAASLYSVEHSDPRGMLVDRTGMDPQDIEQISRLMRAIANLREVEQSVSDASQRYMRLSAQDMRAIHYLIVAGNRGAIVTPGMIAAHLGISAASTTKLLNRLEHGGHISRQLHPTDRRAFAIVVTPETETAAMQTTGRQHAKRFHAAARLSRPEREVVIRFLEDMADELRLTDEPWAQPTTPGPQTGPGVG